MLQLTRKSVEPMVVRTDPMHAGARHLARHHVLTKAESSGREMLRQFDTSRRNQSSSTAGSSSGRGSNA